MWELDAVLALGTKAFEDDFIGEGEPRDETFVVLTVGTDYDFGDAGKGFAGLSYSNNMSNVDVFDVDRTVLQVGYIYEF